MIKRIAPIALVAGARRWRNGVLAQRWRQVGHGHRIHHRHGRSSVVRAICRRLAHHA